MLRLINISILVLLMGTSFAQQEYWRSALMCYQEDSLECASKEIDLAIVDAQEKELAYTWHLRAFIYRAIYKKTDKEDPKSSARATAIAAFQRSLELDQTGDLKANNVKGIEALGISFYNDAIRYLNNYDVEDAIDSYEKHVITMRLADKSYFNKEREMAIKRKAAVIHMDMYNDDKKKNKESFDRAIEYFNDVLELDSNDFNANLNTGVLYHNLAVDLLMETDPELTLDKVMELQQRHVDNMQQSLRYMKTAHGLNPNHPGVIRALAGAYFSLHDQENFEYYNKRLQELEGSGNGDVTPPGNSGEVIVTLVPGVATSQVEEEFKNYGVKLVKEVTDQEGAYLFKYDTSAISNAEIIKLMTASAKVSAAK